MSPELRLVVCCSGTILDPVYVSGIERLVSQNLDYDRVLGLARWHGVLPFVYRNLRSVGRDAVPPHVMESLRGSAHAIAARNAILAGELAAILGLLHSKSLNATSFKGPHLATAAYNDLSLREFSDLDILVPPEQMPDAIAALRSAGYKHIPHEEAELRKYHSVLVRPVSGICATVELHWAFTKPYLATDVPLTAELLGSMDPLSGDMLAALSLHGAYHCWECLKWLCDIAEISRRCSPKTWENALQRSAEWGCKRMLLVGADMAWRMLRAPIPQTILHICGTTPGVRQLSRTLQERIEHGVGDHLDFSDTVRVSYLHYRMADPERRPKFLSNCLKLLVTPSGKDRKFLPLPGSLSALYYGVRPVRLFIELIQGATRNR